MRGESEGEREREEGMDGWMEGGITVNSKSQTPECSPF